MPITMRRAATWNPAQYQQEVLEAAKDDPEQLAKDVTRIQKLRKNAEDAMIDTQRALETVIEVVVAGTGAGLLGFADGHWEARKEQLIKEWEEGGAEEAEADLEEYPEPWDHADGEKNPTKIAGFLPKTLAITLIPTVIAIGIGLAMKGKPTLAGSIFKSLAVGQFSYTVGGFLRNVGYKRKQKKMEEEAKEEAA